jgi:hypothetical protein
VQFPGVVGRSNVGDSYVYGHVCRCDFVISHGGISDIKKHIGTAKHTLRTTDESQSQKLSQFFAPNSEIAVIRAERKSLQLWPPEVKFLC